MRRESTRTVRTRFAERKWRRYAQTNRPGVERGGYNRDRRLRRVSQHGPENDSKGGVAWKLVYFDSNHVARVQHLTGPTLLPSTSTTPSSATYYYDQQHSRGTDLVLMPETKAIVLVNPHTSGLTDTAQAALRLRSLIRISARILCWLRTTR